METLAAIGYGALWVGYIGVLLFTERTAGRYVRGEIAEPHAQRTILVIRPASPITPVAHGAAPAHVPSLLPHH